MTPVCPFRSRSGFTAIELMVVLAMATIIIASSVPPILSAMRHSAAARSADAIIGVANEARRLARSRFGPTTGISAGGNSGSLYGVAITVPESGGPAYAELIFGNNINATYKDPNTGEPISRKYLNANILPYTSVNDGGEKRKYGHMSKGMRIGWFYRPNSGALVDYGVNGGNPREVGTGDSRGLGLVKSKSFMEAYKDTTSPTVFATPSPSALGVATLDGTFGIGLAFFQNGLSFSREIPSKVQK